jgi:serine/threonine protein kinase
MKPLDGQELCTHCHLDQKTYKTIPRCLTAGTTLGGRYVLGRVLGEGTFGITYIAWDTLLETAVAIKEYFPSTLVGRYVGETQDKNVYLFEESQEEYYRTQMKKYLEEAKHLSQFSHLEGIVSVRDFFYENGTAYIVMEYVEGKSLKEYIDTKGVIDGKRLLKMFRPVVEALTFIHKEGMIHRDISPDNILVSSQGNMTLIDFGAMRWENSRMSHTMTVVFKRGYSPEEQYRSKGKQGAWTDIYSLCATMYYALTGKVPDESIERIVGDEVRPLTDMPETGLSEQQKKAIMKGLAVKSGKRYQSMEKFYQAVYCKENQENGVSLFGRFGGVGFAVLLLLLGLVGWTRHQGKGEIVFNGTPGAVEVTTATPASAVTGANIEMDKPTEYFDNNTQIKKTTKKPTQKTTIHSTEKPTKNRRKKTTDEPTKSPVVRQTSKPRQQKSPQKNQQNNQMDGSLDATEKKQETFDGSLP